MWKVTEGEAVEMYARYFAARHRSAASQRARETAERFKRSGDLSGHKIWNEVADTIDRQRHESRHIAHEPSH